MGKIDLNTLKKNVRDFYSEGDKYFDKAFNEALKTCQERKIVEHTETIDSTKLFCKIDDAVEYLKSLKSNGYTEIEERWSGYEDNYFVAIKMETETDYEYYRRFAKEVNRIAYNLYNTDKETKERNRKIK